MFLFQSRPREKCVVVSTNPLYIVPDESDFAAQRELETQRRKWSEFLKNRPNIWKQDWLWLSRLAPPENVLLRKKFMQMFNAKTKLIKQVKGLVRSGVPPELRGEVWYACSGGDLKRRNSPLECQFHVMASRVSELDGTQIAFDIEKDLLRTFPERLSADNVEMINSLRLLLRAYALRNPEVGYCQSMNYLGALLLFHMDEEKAFWAFSALLEDILPNDYYVPSLIGGRIDQQVFQSCIAWKLTKIHEQFRATSTVLEPIICPWFMCLYINVLPHDAVCRVWDCLFWEGSTVLFRIGLSLIKSKTSELLKASDFIGVYSVLKGNTLKTHSFDLEVNPDNQVDGEGMDRTVMSDAEYLIQSSFGYRWLKSVPKEKVEELRQKFSVLLREEREQRLSSLSGRSESSSPKQEQRKARNRKSELMSRLLEENGIQNLRELALQMDEGLGSQVDEFAKELDGCKSTEEGENDDGDVEELTEVTHADDEELRATTLLNQIDSYGEQG